LHQIAAGQNVIRKNKLYEEIDRRLQSLSNRFNDGQVDLNAFLRGIASQPIAF